MSRAPEQPPRRPRASSPHGPPHAAAPPRRPPSTPPPPPPRPLLALRADDFEPRTRPADLTARMEGWAAVVVARLAELEVQVEAALGESGASRASAAQVAFVRARGERAEHGSERVAGLTRLVLGLDAGGVRAGLELPAAQARAARARLADAARALQLATALEALPEQFTTGTSADASGEEAPRATADDVRVLLDRVAQSANDERPGALWIGWRIPRALFVEHAAVLDELLADAIVALAPVFTLLGGEDADSARLDGAQRFLGRRGKNGLVAEDDAARRGEDERERSRGRAARPRRARDRDRDRERQPGADLELAEPEAPRDAAPPGGRPYPAKLPPRPGRRRPVKGAASKPIVRGARVRVLGGPFSGKVGVVQELDGQGGARVMLGLLAVRLEVSNLMVEVEGKGRPLLSSSHRKPIPARS